ncbi:hypothetical protein FACS1894151_01670 [Spirochaetia bacterium]|nr:hypothetical protein FACS1894151_01670 [Spirochaetia bacterium]
MLVQIIASCITDTDYSNNRRSYYSFNKRCRQCSTVYLGSASVCPKCGFSLYEEVADSSSAQPITIGDRSIEKKKCRSCKELVPVDIFKCPKCGNESFD